MTATHASIQRITDQNLEGKTVLVRVDFNLPLKDGKVSDDTRMTRILPGLMNLRDKGAKLVLLSHFGRPKGQHVPEMSLAPIAAHLSALCGFEVLFTALDEAANCIEAALQNDIILLENLRFEAGEEANDTTLARHLAQLGDLYVNDAFSASHRAHASTEGITHHLPPFAGPSLGAELDALAAALEAPKRPVTALVGGAKISTKLAVLENILPKVDHLILGGGMANTFLAAQGVDMAASLVETAMIEDAKRIMAEAKAQNTEIILPQDGLAAREFGANVAHRIADNNSLAADEMVLDIGPVSVETMSAVIEKSATLLWNGPMGAFEHQPFDQGTNALATAAAQRTKAGQLTSIAGGGDTVAALNGAGVSDDFSYLSLAGGAFLEWLEGKELPALAALSRQA
ncbi:MAG: phosphoglycerate kinase [Candidatus Puniceispirillaceae bacterium]